MAQKAKAKSRRGTIEGDGGVDPTSSLADHARAFLQDFRAKVHVFGDLQGNSKHPLASGGFASATDDPTEVERRCSNPRATGFCVYPQDFIVIDLDVGGDKDGLTALANLASKHGEKIPKTAFVSSPRGNGSGHLYFNIPEGASIPSSNGMAPGVDVRGNDGKYWIAGPGSRLSLSETAKGEYRWERGPEHMIEAPLWLLKAAQEAHPRARDGDKPKALPSCVEWDFPLNIRRFIDWLQNEAKPAIEGQNGNDTLAATGAMGSSYALSEETTIQLMAEHWNPRCIPPWDFEDLEYHGGSGWRSAEHTGNMATPNYTPLFQKSTKERLRLAAINGERIDDAPDTRYDELVRFFQSVLSASGSRERRAKRFGDVASTPAPQWIIPGWLSRDAAWIMYGESESFKTYLTLNMLLCVATGTPWAARDGFEGYPVGEPRPVILFVGESYSGVVQRVHTAIAGNGFDRALVEHNLILVPDVCALNFADGLARMADEIEALEIRPAIVAVDTLNLALDGNEDSSDEVKKALRGIRTLASMFGAAGLVIDHVGHRDKARPRGSSAKKANADGMILCERLADTRCVTLTQQKNRDDDKTKYRTAFTGEAVALNSTSAEPQTNLAFHATELPSAGNKASSEEIPEKLFIAEIVGRVVLKILQQNPLREWTNRQLADAVACDADVSIRGDAIRRNYLRPLREENTSPVRHCYDPAKERWRYREGEKISGDRVGI